MQEKRVLDLFLELVRIDSPSRCEADMAKRCERELEDLGFQVHFDDAADETESNVGNLIAKRAGSVPGALVLSAHMDTVNPGTGIEPVVDGDRIHSQSDTILGADDKAGVAAILEGTRAAVESGKPLPEITIIFSTCEEQSLLGARNMERGVIPPGVPCFVLDADGHPGTIINAAPCHCTVRATFKGRAAHAGVEPEKGISAIEMAAYAIEHMKLGRIDEETTANIGIIEGGRQTNVVANSCYIKGECRSIDDAKASACRAAMSRALRGAAEHFGGEVDYSWTIEYPPIRYQKDDPFILSLKEAMKRAGLEPVLRRSGGGADANIHKARGARAITLGIGMTKYHSVNEYILLEDLYGSARLAENLIFQAVKEA